MRRGAPGFHPGRHRPNVRAHRTRQQRPPGEDRASATIAPGRARHRGPHRRRNSGTPPTRACLLGQSVRGSPPCKGPANRDPRRGEEWRGYAGPWPSGPVKPEQTPAPSEVLQDCGDQAGGEVAGQSIERGVLLLEETVEIGGDFIFIAKQKVVVAVERGFCGPVFEENFTANRDEHGGGASGGGVEENCVGFEAGDAAGQDGVSIRGIGDDAISCAGEKFVDQGGGHALLDAVARRAILERQHRDGLHAGWETRSPAGDVIAASPREGAEGQSERRDNADWRAHASFSPMRTALAAARRKLSAAPQSQNPPARRGSRAGKLIEIRSSPATLRFDTAGPSGGGT